MICGTNYPLKCAGVTNATSLQIHLDFQYLYQKNPSEMTIEEHTRWIELQNIIDVEAYTRERPIDVKKTGTVQGFYGGYSGLRIKWDDGREESILFEHAPCEFAAYRAGQKFEAIVSYKLSGKFIELIYSQRMFPPD